MLVGGRYDVWERKCVLSKFVIKNGDIKIFYAKRKHDDDDETIRSMTGKAARKMKRIQKMLLRGGKGRDLIPSISIMNEEIVCERKRATFLWLGRFDSSSRAGDSTIWNAPLLSCRNSFRLGLR